MAATRCAVSRITASAGVAAAETADAEALFAHADASLYTAKRSGRDRVCVDDDSTPGTMAQAHAGADSGQRTDT